LTVPALADVRADGGGRLVVYGIGGTYLLDPDTGQLRRISEVPFAAVNQQVLVDFACDDAGGCQLRVTDRASGQARLLPTPAPADPWAFMNGPLSPDGRYLAYRDEVGRLGVLDLTSGEQRPLALPGSPGSGLGGPAQATWSPDSSLLFWPDTDGLHVWRVGAPQALTIDRPDWPTFLALVALPA
jgi:hypothetical protein